MGRESPAGWAERAPLGEHSGCLVHMGEGFVKNSILAKDLMFLLVTYVLLVFKTGVIDILLLYWVGQGKGS